MLVEAGDLIQRVVLASMRIAGVVAELSQFAEDSHADFGPESQLEFGQGSHLVSVEPRTDGFGREGCGFA